MYLPAMKIYVHILYFVSICYVLVRNIYIHECKYLVNNFVNICNIQTAYLLSTCRVHINFLLHVLVHLCVVDKYKSGIKFNWINLIM